MKILNESNNVRKLLKKKVFKELPVKLTPQQAKLNKRIARYRSIANIPDDEPITEDNLDMWVLRRTCNLEGWDFQRAKREILGLQFEGYEL